MEETTKDKTIKLAKEKPFSSLEEIANKCNTTAHYVRTVLSENGISLTALRKEAYFDLKSKYQRLLAGIVAEEAKNELEKLGA